jgi:TolB-like protein/DNA-binding winged helix-turn-helix (wHTH) protein/Tfp pilus assembly protein PilF
MPQQACQYRFGPFELRTATRELYKHGVRLKLRPQAYQVLVMLLERAGEGVTREELQTRVWPANTFVDFEHGLNTAIKELRRVLSDSAAEPRYIETLPKLGYRVIVAVEVGTGAVGDGAKGSGVALAIVESVSTNAKTAGMESGISGRWRWKAAVVIGALVVMGMVAAVKWPRAQRQSQKAATNGRMMLAVLPFENLTGEEGQDYFSDGLTEEMIAQLGRLNPQEFGVIARTSVMHYKHTAFQTEQIGNELGVQYVLEGSVRRDAVKVRINAQLIKVGSQTPLWAREYDRELTNLLAVQAEIAHEISDEIQLTLGAQKLRPPGHKPTLTPQAYQAYDLYLKGLFFWNKRSLPGFQQAIEYFQQAIAKDAKYAPAYAGLANSYTLLTAYSMAPTSKYMPRARAAALRALELDDSLPEAHVALALIVENYDWDWNAAEKEYRRAIELNPNYATAHHWYAELLTWRGRFEEALRESDSARRLDPLSLIIASDHAGIFYYSRKYDQAIEQFNAVLEMDPNFPRAYQVIDAYLEKGLFAEALVEMEKWRRTTGDGPMIWAKMAYVYGRSGQKERARSQLEKVEAANRKQPLDPTALVLANIGAGNNEVALSWLEKGHFQHSNSLTALKVEPAYDPLRGDPRFQELLRRVGLAQ